MTCLEQIYTTINFTRVQECVGDGSGRLICGWLSVVDTLYGVKWRGVVVAGKADLNWKL